MSTAGVVKLDHLTKTYAGRTVVDDVSFTLTPGTVTGFLGPNGAGKSTTLRMLLGLVRPTSGTAHINGMNYQHLQRPATLIGAVLEANDFHPARSGRNHLRVLAAQAGLAPHRILATLELVGIADAAESAVGTYSLGMRQRLGLAAALLGEPQILVLDEPANGLDPAGVRWLRSLLREFADQGGTVLMSSHLLAELAQTVDRVLIVSAGRLRSDSDLAALQTGGRTLEDAYVDLTAPDNG